LSLLKCLPLTSSKNIDTYIYINTVVVVDACGSFGYRANNDGYRRLASTGCEQTASGSDEHVSKTAARASVSCFPTKSTLRKRYVRGSRGNQVQALSNLLEASQIGGSSFPQWSETASGKRVNKILLAI
jgi:hypothetical protein